MALKTTPQLWDCVYHLFFTYRFRAITFNTYCNNVLDCLCTFVYTRLNFIAIHKAGPRMCDEHGQHIPLLLDVPRTMYIFMFCAVRRPGTNHLIFLCSRLFPLILAEVVFDKTVRLLMFLSVLDPRLCCSVGNLQFTVVCDHIALCGLV